MPRHPCNKQLRLSSRMNQDYIYVVMHSHSCLTNKGAASTTKGSSYNLGPERLCLIDFDSQNEEFYGSISGRFYTRICIIRPKQSRLPTMHGGTKYSPENSLTKISLQTIRRKDCTCTCKFILKLCATRGRTKKTRTYVPD